MSALLNPEFIALYRGQYPLAQLRTHSHRVFTFYHGGEYRGDYYINATRLFKGPYLSDTQRAIYSNVKNKAIIFQQLITIGKPTLVILPIAMKNWWIEFPNMNPHPQHVTMENDSFLHYGFDGNQFIPTPDKKLQLPTVRRKEDPNFLKLTQYLDGRIDINTTFVAQHGFALLYTYVMMFLLKVGDIGLSNTLVDIPRQLIFVVDFDEPVEHNARTGRYFFLRGNPAKAYAFDRLVAQNIESVLSLLQELVRNTEFVTGVNYHMQMIYPDYNFTESVHDFTFRINEAYPELHTGIRRIFPVVVMSREEVTVEDTSNCPISIFADSHEPVPLFSREELPMAKSRWIFSGPTPISKMSISGGFRAAITWSGNPISVISSMLQKSIRRNALTNALIAMNEMHEFITEASGKAVVTNLINRLCVIAVEDVGIANVPLVLDVLFTLSTSRNSTPFNTLVAIVAAMTESQHSRFCSHIFRVYSNLEKMQNYARMLNNPDLPIITANSRQICEVTAQNSLSYAFDGILPTPSDLLSRITHILSTTSNPQSRYRIITLMAMYFFQASKPLKGDKNPMLKPDLPAQQMSDLLRSFMLPENMYTLFLSVAKSVSDKRAIFTFAAVFAIFNFPEEKSVLLDYEHLWSTNDINITFLTKLQMKQYEVIVDDVVRDIHTGKKKTDASLHAFRSDGALVANEYAVDIHMKELYV